MEGRQTYSLRNDSPPPLSQDLFPLVHLGMSLLQCTYWQARGQPLTEILGVKVCPHLASAAAAASASPLEYIVTLGNQFSSVTMYFNGDAAAAADADPRCGQTLKAVHSIETMISPKTLTRYQKSKLTNQHCYGVR